MKKGPVKHIAFTMYQVKDVARARRFYEGALGLRVTNNYRNQWVEYHLGNGCFAITSMAKGVKPGASIAFEVGDVDQTLKALRKMRVQVKLEPFESPVCRMAVVMDGQGNAVTIHAKKPGR